MRPEDLIVSQAFMTLHYLDWVAFMAGNLMYDMESRYSI